MRKVLLTIRKIAMTQPTSRKADLVYQLNDRPPLPQTLFAALQHLLAMFVAVITPSLIICQSLGVPADQTNTIISMSLFASGLSSFIQIRTFGPIGSGLLSIQGTSFNFLGPIIGAGLALKAGGADIETMMAAIFGTILVASSAEILLSRVLQFAQRIITPLVSGIVVTLIGLTLVQVGLISMGGGYAAMADGSFGSLDKLALAGTVLAIIVLLNRAHNPYVRVASIVIAMLVGYVMAYLMGMVNTDNLAETQFIALPIPMQYGLGFDWSLFIPLVLIFLITALEAIGDITATSEVSGEPVKGPVYMKRIKGGVLADGLNSALAAVFNSFPNSTFSQNNGVILLTGVASRYVGYFIAGMLVLLGLFPGVASFVQLIPEPVLGGATIVMFGTIAAAGVRIISRVDLDRRAILIMALSFSMGLGIAQKPEILQFMPEFIKNLFSSGVAAGGITAIVLNLLLPEVRRDEDAASVAKTEAAQESN
ncbi:TPA: uracil-xanthine permease [Vibrio cholerae]|uniref:Xanthine/uracil permease family protein n=25 Tax=Gammaproteobacteria TaxID=1236 RepID=Q9KNM0_VIBCH|nr:xanthine/uracil permease family protein [Vibrio cholerae O1 biovar El Tor str. N16961]ACP06926.1 xanthine/uracil permease family protein [Vibrio cholerae M66-2]ACQ59824.1 xanthine/uracil permease protein [Vibrio cholerae MJ-1236]ARB82284.1 xanthine permease XanP [Vibrio cholerae]AVH52813.1 xanthine permease XanP [Vibrio cholerae O1 biovar El Tor]EAZ74596.1 xanthine/uracil permease family protein [Vibrio cholerae NCTC 8457]EAZ78443.1 xanthine/uracil permease family protein [Vibrio cholerae 